MQDYDVVVVGAGVLGLAHAYHLARRKCRVLVVERHAAAQGASIRNFGMLWPIGQPYGERSTLATRSRSFWLEILRSSGIWHDPCGSLHVAYHEDEFQVLKEFQQTPANHVRECQLLDAAEVVKRFPMIRREQLQGGLFSPLEICVDPRQVIAELPAWLQKSHGIDFRFGTTALKREGNQLLTSGGTVTAKHLIVCGGDEFNILYPDLFAASGLIRCKLQMMRTQGFGTEAKVGTMLAAGLTLNHYQSFLGCPTLSVLQKRLQQEYPEYLGYGIHVLLSQNGHGEFVLGDSHEYEKDISIFDKSRIDELVLQYLQKFIEILGMQIASRWHGIYTKHPNKPWLVETPEPDVRVVTGVGGAGMTLSFGLADRVVAELLGELAHAD